MGFITDEKSLMFVYHVICRIYFTIVDVKQIELIQYISPQPSLLERIGFICIISCAFLSSNIPDLLPAFPAFHYCFMCPNGYIITL